jgi:hypothetical protein
MKIRNPAAEGGFFRAGWKPALHFNPGDGKGGRRASGAVATGTGRRAGVRIQDSADEWKAAQAQAGFRDRNERRVLQVLHAVFHHSGQQVGEFFGTQALDSDANDRGARRARERQLGMKIRIQRNDDLAPRGGVD